MSIRFGISMIFWIFAKFLRVRKLFWIVAAMSAIAPLRSGHPGLLETPRTYEAKTPAPAGISKNPRRSRPISQTNQLLQLDRRAGSLQLLDELVRVLLREALLHGLGSTFDEVLGLLQAQPRDRANFLDDVDL